MHRFLLPILMLVLSSTSEAREMFGRIGLGYNAQFAQASATDPGAPGVSFKYGFNPRTMLELIGGYRSGSESSGVAALKLMQTMHSESYLNFYFLVGFGVVSLSSSSGTELISGFGTEFFLPGLESIGISFEAGLDFENYSASSNSYILKTFGASFLNAGMHYYF
jgi:hypothetical protein